MIKKIKGNIFNTSCQTLVNTVNCVGIMGKGIALECKLRFPDMFEKYKEFCEKKLIKPGSLQLWSNSKPWFHPPEFRGHLTMGFKFSNQSSLEGSFKN